MINRHLTNTACKRGLRYAINKDMFFTKMGKVSDITETLLVQLPNTVFGTGEFSVSTKTLLLL